MGETEREEERYWGRGGRMRGSELEKDRESEKRTDVVRERERKVERKRKNR